VLSVAPAPPTPREAALAARPETLSGETYKIKWPESAHAVYVTINDIESDGVRRPFEIFVNSKNMEHYAWTVGLTRMISAVFRRGGDVSFVPEELKAVFDPRGGGWINGRYVPSLLAAIGGVIERHLLALKSPSGDAGEREPSPTGAETRFNGSACPRCGGQSLLRKEGCDACVDCGYSKCS
jgi:ribonucleoside-diphosphate reductase alpha chain